MPAPVNSAYIFGAFLFRACSRVSRTTMPAPSPMTKPSLSLSKGLDALSGASFLVDSAFMEQKPASPRGVMADSVPPAISMSLTPFLIMCRAVPSACAPEAQALTVAKFTPFNPNCIATCPAAMSGINIGMRKGETRDGPLLSNISSCSSMTFSPPMPAPMITPTLSFSSSEKTMPLS